MSHEHKTNVASRYNHIQSWYIERYAEQPGLTDELSALREEINQLFSSRPDSTTSETDIKTNETEIVFNSDRRLTASKIVGALGTSLWVGIHTNPESYGYNAVVSIDETGQLVEAVVSNKDRTVGIEPEGIVNFIQLIAGAVREELGDN